MLAAQWIGAHRNEPGVQFYPCMADSTALPIRVLLLQASVLRGVKVTPETRLAFLASLPVLLTRDEGYEVVAASQDFQGKLKG
jgi:hypothetical protein